jgi:hypothetical protein
MEENRPPSGDRPFRRRPPCRNFGGDPRSRELAAQIVERSGRISALHREQLSDIAEFDRAEGWRGDGAVSMIAWVTGQCGVSSSTARQWVRSAVRLESLPCLAEGLASGALSLDLVEPLAEVASPSTDAALREASAHWSVRQARELVAWHRAREEAEAEAKAAAKAELQGDESEAAENLAAREYEHRTLRFNDSRQSVWVSFPKDDYAMAKSTLVRRVEAENGPPASDAVGYIPYDKRLYDQLMSLFQAGNESGSESGDNTGRSSGSSVRPRVVVHAPLELLVGCSDDAVAEIAGVGPIPAEMVRRLTCDAHVDLAVEDADGSILDQGRARRYPSPVQRVEIDRRDKGCRFPGCSYKEFTRVHHIQHWVNGGSTNLDNLVTLCDRHHRAVHELGWTVLGDANGVLTFKSPHKRSTTSAPSPTWRASSVVRSMEEDRNGPLRR